MLYVKSVKLLEKKYSLPKNLKIKMKQLTVLVGDQGCGKSTLLNLMQVNSEIIKLKLSDDAINNGVSTFYFDSEKMNPRTSDPNNYANLDGISKGIGYGGALKSHFMSHGEVLVNFTVHALKKAKNCFIFLDEPESALSLRNQYLLVKELKMACERDVQIIVATHCLPLIEQVDEVYSLEHHKWMKSQDFIDLNKN